MAISHTSRIETLLHLPLQRCRHLSTARPPWQRYESSSDGNQCPSSLDPPSLQRLSHVGLPRRTSLFESYYIEQWSSYRYFDNLPRCGRGLPRKSCFQGGRHRAACQRVVRCQQSDHERRTMSRTRSWWQWQITAALGLYVHKLYYCDYQSDREQARGAGGRFPWSRESRQTGGKTWGIGSAATAQKGSTYFEKCHSATFELVMLQVTVDKIGLSSFEKSQALSMVTINSSLSFWMMLASSRRLEKICHALWTWYIIFPI